MPPKRLHLIRHAQGYHNLSIENHQLRDPLLTPHGEQECLARSRNIRNTNQRIDCIVASPLRRALHTALSVFRDVLDANPDLKIIALPELQETSSLPCDVGLPLDDLLQHFQGKPIDFSKVKFGWNNKLSGPFSPRIDLVQNRILEARRFLRDLEGGVAVVTHGGLLHFLTDDWVGCLNGVGTGWSNCEMRSYKFDMSNDAAISNASIIELPKSLSGRRYTQKPLSRDEQLALREVAYQMWQAEGYIALPNAEHEEDVRSLRKIALKTRNSAPLRLKSML